MYGEVDFESKIPFRDVDFVDVMAFDDVGFLESECHLGLLTAQKTRADVQYIPSIGAFVPAIVPFTGDAARRDCGSAVLVVGQLCRLLDWSN